MHSHSRELTEAVILLLYRICNKLHYNTPNKTIFHKLIIGGVYRFYGLLLGVRYGGYLPYKAIIPKSTIFKHSLYGVFISEGAIIGNNCIIYHHVTIGSKYERKTKTLFLPEIKDDVFIGANACIIGKSIVGNNASIGAGCTIVDKKIKDGTSVVSAVNRVILHGK